MDRILKNKYMELAKILLSAFMFVWIGGLAQAQTYGSLHNNVQQQKAEELIIEQGADLKQVLNMLETHFNIVFLYRSEAVANKKVNQKTAVPGVNVEQALNVLLEDTGLHFKYLNPKTYGIYADQPEPALLPADDLMNETVTGRVVDAQTGESLPGVNIVVEGTTTGTTTNMNGEFELEVQSLEETLVFSYIGYERLVVDIDGRRDMIIELRPDIQMLDDLIVIGYGVQNRLSVTNSISQVSGEEVTRRPVSDFRQSLQGLSSGVTVVDGGGRPGQNQVDIRIRGLTTLGNNNPLILVDGIEQDVGSLNPNDIESVSILKDASSAAIYGSRAANGVVLITTKRADAGTLLVEYDGYFAIQDAVNRPRHVGLEDYFRMENVAFLNAGREARFSEEYIQNYVANAPSPEYPLPYPFFRRDDLGILKLAPQHNHSLSLSGGTETIRARASIRHQDIDGIAPNYGSQINEFRVNTDLQPTERLSFSGDFNLRNQEDFRPQNEPFNWMLHASKFSWPRYDTGEYGLGPQLNNPLFYAEQSGLRTTETNRVIGSIRGNYNIFPNLSFSTQYALRLTNLQFKQFNNRYFNQDPINGRINQRTTNSLQEYRQYINEYTLNNILEFIEDFNQHNINALLGYSEIHHENNVINAFRENFYNNEVQSLSQGSSENIGATGSDSEWALRSFFGRMNYNFADKYLLEINARYDGSSRFSRDNRYSFFPSVSAGWRLSQESFWNVFRSTINEFKIRASRGTTGNQAVGLYTYFETLSSQAYSFNEQPTQAFSQTSIASRDLTWETTKQTNFGLDAGLLNDRLLFTFDYYRKTTEDILLNLPIPRTIGLLPAPQNAGAVQNNGYEISVIFRGGNKLQYNIGMNFSDNRNEVISLAGTGPFIIDGETLNNPTFIIKEGLPINSLWGYRTDGLFQTQEEVDNYPTLVSNTRPGDIKYVDLNGDGLITPEDQTFLGLSFPQYDFGLNLDLMYNNFELHTRWQGAAGHHIRFTGANKQIVTFETFTHAVYNDYWTPDNPNARWPRPIKNDRRNDEGSDMRQVKGDYLRLKNVVLSYNIPPAISERFSIRGARIYAGATNVLTFSALNDWNYDPETPSGRSTYYPQLRTYTIGLNLQF